MLARDCGAITEKNGFIIFIYFRPEFLSLAILFCNSGRQWLRQLSLIHNS
jgi:hypothetical protein